MYSSKAKTIGAHSWWCGGKFNALELKLCAPLLQWVAELLTIVEDTGAWPAELSRGETVLLPKGGSSDPLDRRPITLLPIQYRIWASLRATQLRAWMRKSGIPPLVEGARGTMLSAEHLGLLLALELEEAQAFGQALVGVAVDRSKCYDHLGFGYVRAMLQAAGVPSWVANPLLAMYEAPGTSKSTGPWASRASPRDAYHLAALLL